MTTYLENLTRESGVWQGVEPDEKWARKIARLKHERNAVILAHNYQIPAIQDIADFTGDSLALSRKAADTDADVIVFCGVHFMAESAKILSPTKTVLIPDKEAGCSLADSITADQLRQWRSEHPDAVVVSYVNTTAEVKALTDICCTSSNAVDVVESIDPDTEVLFCPDQFLGAHVKRETGRDNIRIWSGECHVHAGISATKLAEQAEANPDADLYIHPECGCANSAIYLAGEGIIDPERVHMLSTGGMLELAHTASPERTVLVATEIGMLHQLRGAAPGVNFQSVNDRASCRYMKMITPAALLRCLAEGKDEVDVPTHIADKARASLEAMISIGEPGGGE
ncbi:MULTISPECIES: quinolinate synthase NadA [Corynebacterium]|uniref:quinolinate synthase NadA n=1 Tax=Corynebacterium TaxID=1716 RepID=UPI0021AF08F8|nr:MULTISPECIES: quinolinate synthase NadA [Corynebacterium]MCT1413923.1 quinolinate synthase NadA [Corynebacterium sanguinis]MCT2154399.1 quinolinate synthase NadA [Corynebacterium sanguinis]WNI13013.1 quinolinate synthase NadA [Corynebacterium sp. Z-1]